MDWIVHIGAQKTGSKAIQEFLGHEPHRIAGRTFCFPSSGRVGTWHRPIHEELANGQSDLLQAAIQEGIETLAEPSSAMKNLLLIIYDKEKNSIEHLQHWFICGL